ncbi:glycoside hydrolase family 3 domain protein [Gracilinema caldarium DSM 7334]|uniref:beta-glucosidase n=2 Tax=Gracilinema caldarium TaxID=215591 RepID=F8EYX3_GRAC1|nr:glycoside hydrolase family 3 domain protein [Gracilinema caldarium DSM 7334]
MKRDFWSIKSFSLTILFRQQTISHLKDYVKKIKKCAILFCAGIVIMILLSCTGPSRSESPVPANAPYKKTALAVEKRVEDLLSRMTLEEKLGQMTQIEKGSLRSGDISRYKLGSVLSGGGGALTQNTIVAWNAMIAQYQEEARATRLQIPLLYGIDAVHGHNNLQNTTMFPHNIGLGAAGDSDLVRRIGQAYIEGFQSAVLPVPLRPIATAKHFLGDGEPRWGSSKTDTYKIDQGDTQADATYLQDVLFPPYQQAIKAGVRTIMVSFSSLNGIKMHAHRELITDLLKKTWGFTGFVVSDWGGIDQVDPDYSKQHGSPARKAQESLMCLPVKFPARGGCPVTGYPQ